LLLGSRSQLLFSAALPDLRRPAGSVAVKTIRRERCRSDEVRLSPWPPPHVNNGHPEWAVSSGARVDSIGEIDENVDAPKILSVRGPCILNALSLVRVLLLFS